MPDNPRNFDDDLTPDWLRNFDVPRGQSKPPQGVGQPFNAPPPRMGSTPRAPVLPPWDQMPGGKAPVPPPPGHTPAPWIQLQGPDVSPPNRAAIPWAETPGGMKEEPIPPAFAPRPIGGQGQDIPRGMTGTLPWMSAAEQQPSRPAQPAAEDAAWLSGFGQAASFDLSAPTSEEMDLDWLAGAAPPPAGQPPAESEVPPWLADEEAFGTGQPEAAPSEDVSGMGWLRAEAEQAAEPAAESELPPWLADEEMPASAEEWPAEEMFGFDSGQAAPEQPQAEQGFGWMAGDDLRTVASESPEATDEGDMLWLADNAFDDVSDQPLAAGYDSGMGAGGDEPGWQYPEEEEPEESEAAHIPDWILSSQDEEPPVEAPRPASGIRRIRPAEEPQPPEEEAGSVPDWVLNPPADQPAKRPGSGIRRIQPTSEPELPPYEAEGLTYDEWEQRQIEREQEARKTDADRMMEEVPDWFDQLDRTSRPEPETGETVKPSEPEFRPSWFMGLEEQPAEEAPDWFKNIDYSADILAVPTIPEPTLPPADQPAPSMDDVPDWFKGAADVPGSDEWASMFGAPQPPVEEEPERPAFKKKTAPEPPSEAAGEPVPGDWLAAPETSGELAPEDWFAAEPEPVAQPFGRDDMPPVPDWSAGSDEAVQGVDEWAPDFQGSDFQTPDMQSAPADLSNLDEWMAAPQPPAESSWDLPLPGTGALIGRDAVLGDVPDWLSEAAPGGSDLLARPEDIPFPEMDIEEQPAEDWMTTFAPSEAPAVRPTSRPAPESEDFVERFEPMEQAAPIDAEAPAWLRDMAASDEEVLPVSPDIFGGEPEPSYGAGSGLGADEGLDWLSILSPEDISAEPEMPPLPDIEAPKAKASEEPFGGTDIDQLLSLYQPPAPEAELDLELPGGAWSDKAWPAEAESVGAGEGDDLDTLRLAAMPHAPHAPDEAIELDLFAAADLLPEPEPAAPEPPEEAPLPAEMRPEWLAEMRPSDLPVTVKAGGAEKSVTQKQVLELSQRIRALRDESLQAIDQPPTAPAASGPLAGISGALPLVDVVLAQERAAVPVRGLTITPEQQMRVARLQNLLDVVAAEEEAAEKPEGEAALARHARRRTRFKPDRLLVTVLMLIALIAPFATDTIHFADDPPILSGDRADAVAAIDAAIQPDGTFTHPPYILFAFEYGPASAGELDDLAEAVLRDTLVHGAVPITTSTDPAGALHAEAVLGRLADDEALLLARLSPSDLVQGRDYFTLSYLPGEAMGIHSLRDVYRDEAGLITAHPAFDTDLHGDDTGLNIGDIEQDIALIVVIGESSDDVRSWAEQLEGADVPKITLATAAAESLVPPYVNQDGYQGYLAGYRDTYRYNADRNAGSRQPYTVPADIDIDLPNTEDAQWHSLSLGAAAAAGLIALGMVLNLFRAMIRRARR